MREQLTPNIARLRNLTYESEIFLEVQIQRFKRSVFENDGEEVPDGEPHVNSHVKIGKVPIMVRSKFCKLHYMETENIIKSGECVYDQGGYFIVNGQEKVIVAQERMANNFVYLF